MVNPQVLTTLNTKRKEIETHIGSLECDLSANLAVIRVFSADGVQMTACMNLSRPFPRHELPNLAKAALGASPGGLSAVAIAAHVIATKALDQGDRRLRKRYRRQIS